MNADHSSNIAVLIDRDNVTPKAIVGLMAEIANYGTANVKRIYGDWTSPGMTAWKMCLLEYSITPMQQFAYTKGKNATDGSMIIDAMDLLYAGRFDSFCIVSSDSDFTRLAGRLREQNVTVYGFGEQHTPLPFVAACDKFVYLDALDVARNDVEQPSVQQNSPESYSASDTILRRRVVLLNDRPKRRIDSDVCVSIIHAIANSQHGADGYVGLADVGNHLRRISPALNSKNYGYDGLLEFVEASRVVETKRQQDNHPVVRIKPSLP